MKFSMSWLKRHLDSSASLNEICEKLTALGLEVEGVNDPAALYAPFKVALVESAAPHPSADKLQILSVKTKDASGLQVVCGAPNARAGMKGVFAPEGSYIPGLDVTLKKTAIRSVESNGMMVSEKEMCLSDEHKGIIEVGADVEIGTPLSTLYGLDDPVIEINLTPNRVDCAAVRGIARDLAAANLGTLKSIDDAPVQGRFSADIAVHIKDSQGCPLFLGRVIRGVKNGPSPVWLQNLLKSIGQKPISALVDITNLMTHEYARPLHVYDRNKLQGDIVVDSAAGGEEFSGLNDKTYALCAGAITINDQSGVIGLGGILGGISTRCTDDTTDVFLEAAYFAPPRIAKTGRALGIESDARYRFERGVDPAFTRAGMEIATRLILEICGGEASEIVQAGDVPAWERAIAFDPDFVQKLIGVNIEKTQQKSILEALGFVVQGGGPFTVTPPSWRGDVEGQADLAEEIIRVTGLDLIPALPVRSDKTVPPAAETPLLARMRKSRTALVVRGLSECITWSFVAEKNARAFGANDAQISALTLKNPISSEMDVMRPSILPNLIEAAQRNAARGYPHAALCEIGPVFAGARPEDQAIVACGLRSGSTQGVRHWADSTTMRAVDAFDAKADAFAALESCGFPADNAQITRDAPAYYHPGRSGSLRLGPNVLGYFGEIHPKILEDMDIKFPVVGFEILLQNIPAQKKKASAEKPLLKLEALQPVTRDFAFLVEDKVESSALVRAALSVDKTLVCEAHVFDIYTGKGVEEGKKSVALTIKIQPQGQSLTEKDLEALSQKVIGTVQQKTGGVLRG